MVIKHKLLDKRCAENVTKLNNNENVWIKKIKDDSDDDSVGMDFDNVSARSSQSVSAVSNGSESSLGVQNLYGNVKDKFKVNEGDKRIKKFYKYWVSLFFEILDKIWTDIIFIFFMASQELDDTSFLKTMELRAVYHED